MRSAVIALTLALGCGGTSAGSKGTGDPRGTGTNPDQISESDGGGVDPASPVTADECERFTANALELNMVLVREEMKRKGTPELIPTDEQVAEIREKLAAECLGFPRAVVECGAAAATLQAFADCQDRAPDGWRAP
jgi:hypothetical protein